MTIYSMVVDISLRYLIRIDPKMQQINITRRSNRIVTIWFALEEIGLTITK